MNKISICTEEMKHYTRVNKALRKHSPKGADASRPYHAESSRTQTTRVDPERKNWIIETNADRFAAYFSTSITDKSVAGTPRRFSDLKPRAEACRGRPSLCPGQRRRTVNNEALSEA